MRIKITQPGWETYSSDLGCTQFKDGVSLAEVSRAEALRLGAFISVIEIDEDGNELGQISPAIDVLRQTKVKATVNAGLERVQAKPTFSEEVENLNENIVLTAEEQRIRDVRLAQKQNEEAGRMIADAVASTVAAPALHTEASLEAIASEKGIAGLRDVAAPLNVKHTSVKGLMSEILVAQAAAQAKAV